MHPSPPDPDQFTAQLTELHRKGTSPNRMFGFSVTTFDGQNPPRVAWQKDWADFFTLLIKGVLGLDRKANGTWPDLDVASKQLFASVVPELLGNLKHNGEPVRPCLIHGDCDEGNAGTVSETVKIVLFDAGAYYAHDEMEMGIWRAQFCQAFAQEKYLEEWEDRSRLYRMKNNLNYGAGHPGSITRER